MRIPSADVSNIFAAMCQHLYHALSTLLLKGWCCEPGREHYLAFQRQTQEVPSMHDQADTGTCKTVGDSVNTASFSLEPYMVRQHNGTCMIDRVHTPRVLSSYSKKAYKNCKKRKSYEH
jgi:hypothetical protein